MLFVNWIFLSECLVGCFCLPNLFFKKIEYLLRCVELNGANFTCGKKNMQLKLQNDTMNLEHSSIYTSHTIGWQKFRGGYTNNAKKNDITKRI